MNRVENTVFRTDDGSVVRTDDGTVVRTVKHVCLWAEEYGIRTVTGDCGNTNKYPFDPPTEMLRPMNPPGNSEEGAMSTFCEEIVVGSLPRLGTSWSVSGH